MKDIISIPQLILELKREKTDKVLDLIHRINIPLADYLPFNNWSKKAYTRNCIASSAEYELILLCWLPGQKTPIHCHGGEECAVLLVDGSIREARFRQLGNGDLTQYGEGRMLQGDISYMNDDFGYHLLENDSDHDTMSLHLYMKPIKSCQVFNDDSGEFETKQLKYFYQKETGAEV